MIWFTADTHFSHRNILAYSKRPFSSVEEMDNVLIANWNEIVDPTDEVYFLGDFCLKNWRVTKEYIRRLNGFIYFIPGSHDKQWLRGMTLEKEKEFDFKVLPPIHLLYDKPNYLILCHYAMRVWDKSHYNSWQLYAHSHARLRPVGKQHDVGVDNNNYYPISLPEVRKLMQARPNNVNYIGKGRNG